MNNQTPHGLADPWLIGYDAHGIQEFITASNRPLAMLGASATVKNFDADAARTAKHSIFAGGGRGIELVDGPIAADTRCRHLVSEYARATLGGVISTAQVPLDGSNEAAPLRWLRQRLELVKDATPPPGRGFLSPFLRKSDQCADCRTYEATLPSERRDARAERVCPRCHAMIRRGREGSGSENEEIQSLLDLTLPGEYIAAISLDGNNLGVLFESLDSLDATREASESLKALFVSANTQALASIQGRRVSLATGGDDIRLFITQSQTLTYLDTLIPALEQGADALPCFRGRRERFGVGVGVVLADPHMPAKRLMEYAHDLERSAKKRCRPGHSPARSALDFAVLTAGDASRIDPSLRPPLDGRPIALNAEWQQLRNEALALAQVPTAQYALLRDSPTTATPEFVEFANQWRYQVARSTAWQCWYDNGRDWRDREKVVEQRPRPVHFDLLHLVGRGHRPETQRSELP